MKYDVQTMLNALKISDTGYWESDIQLYHERCEPLCDWIIKYFGNNKSKLIYDMGCGNGQYLKKLHGAGFTNLIGIEGKLPKHQEYHNIIEQDLSKPFNLPDKGNCIFLEVAEHIPKDFEDVVLNNVINCCDDRLVMSWAVKGQGGQGHVNELDNDEAIIRLENKGMKFLKQDTAEARDMIKPGEFCWWFKNTILIFKREVYPIHS